MKQFFFGLITVLLFSCTKDTPIPDLPANGNPTNNPINPLPSGNNSLFINEFMAKNNTISCPDSGNGNYKRADWIEIYNPNNNPVNVGGYFVTDILSDPTKFQIPKNDAPRTTIPSKGHLIIWCDARPLGPTHASFNLSKGGEQIGLVKPDGETFLDSISFGIQADDVSYGRAFDGSSTWKFFAPATPGASNQ